MSNLTLAIVLWALTVISAVAAFKIKQKTVSMILGILTLPLGIAAFGFSYDATSDYRVATSNKEYYERNRIALNDSIKALTAADRARYANIKSIIKEHLKDTQPLVCDPSESKANYAEVVSKIQRDSKEYGKLGKNESKEKLLIDNCFYLSCISDTVGFNNIIILSNEYEETVVDFMRANESDIDELLKLTSEQLRPGNQWSEENRNILNVSKERVGRFMEMMRHNRYLVLVYLEYALKPQLGNKSNAYTTSFESGYGCSRVDVYDIDYCSQKESFRVFFTNDDDMTQFYSLEKGSADQGTKDFLWRNLLGNMKRTVILELARHGYPHHTK